MNVKNIEKEGSKAKITLEIERDLMDAGANKAYLKARKEIQRPGSSLSPFTARTCSMKMVWRRSSPRFTSLRLWSRN